MDYQKLLQNQLLSSNNIDYLVELIISNFRISKKATIKCINIITNNLSTYLNNIDRFPENNNELLDAINFLNNKCIEDFAIYLAKKYPNTNIFRNSSNRSSQPNQVNQYSQSNQISPSNQVNKFSQSNQINQSSQINQPDQLNQHSEGEEFQEFIILTEQEKNHLLKTYGINSSMTNKKKYKKTIEDDVITILSNPIMMQMFGLMLNQSSQPKKPDIVFDQILDSKQVIELKSQFQNNLVNSKTTESKTTESKTTESKTTNPKSNIINSKINDETDNKFNNKPNEKINDETNDEPGDNDEIDNNEIGDNIDLNVKLDNITTSDVPVILDKLRNLKILRETYVDKGNKKIANKIQNKIIQIVDTLNAYKNKQSQIAIEAKNKIKHISVSNKEVSENVELIELEFNPNCDLEMLTENNYINLKNLFIKKIPDRKITDITLVEYLLPNNDYNITKFNNKFKIYSNSRLYSIDIPPSKYEINTLLSYIKNQLQFIDFQINDDNIISIKSQTDFELIVDRIEETVFPILGFNGKQSDYKDKSEYIATKSYNLNSKVYFSLQGVAMEPIEVIMGTKILYNKSIKKSSAGITIKNLVLNFKTDLDQFYDFNDTFKMSLSITYQS